MTSCARGILYGRYSVPPITSHAISSAARSWISLSLPLHPAFLHSRCNAMPKQGTYDVPIGRGEAGCSAAIAHLADRAVPPNGLSCLSLCLCTLSIRCIVAIMLAQTCLLALSVIASARVGDAAPLTAAVGRQVLPVSNPLPASLNQNLGQYATWYPVGDYTVSPPNCAIAQVSRAVIAHPAICSTHRGACVPTGEHLAASRRPVPYRKCRQEDHCVCCQA